MSRPQPGMLPADPRDGVRAVADVPKARQCLSCKTGFNSEWAGERICPACKRKSLWTSGALPRSY